MYEKSKKEEENIKCNLKVKSEWSIVTVQELLKYDFYIGTFLQRKYKRTKINGLCKKVEDKEQLVFENHHEAIIDYRTFAEAQDNLKARTKNNYRGIKKYENNYSGILQCGWRTSFIISLEVFSCI